MNLNEVITRLDAIATDRYPMITDSDVEALKIAMDIVKEKELEFPKEVLSSSFDTKMLIDYMKYEGEEMSSISAIQYGQIIEEEKTNVDTDAGQTEDSEQ